MTNSPAPRARAHRHPARVALGYAALAVCAGAVWAICTDASVGPDVVVFTLYGPGNYVNGAPVDGKRAYAAGLTEARGGDAAAAAAWFGRALELEPGFRAARENLAGALAALGRDEEARALLAAPPGEPLP